MGTEVCTCGAPVHLAETQLRLGAQTVGCRACNYTGRADVRTTRAKLITSITNPCRCGGNKYHTYNCPALTNNVTKGAK